MKRTAKRWGYLYCILAGACDGLTGILLVLAPVLTLRLMQIPAIPAEPVYLRFVGVFVMSVGCTYLIPFIMQRDKLDLRLVHVLGFTAFIRICVALFIAVSVAVHALVPGWLAVLCTDAVFAGVQVSMLKSGVFSSES